MQRRLTMSLQNFMCTHLQRKEQLQQMLLSIYLSDGLKTNRRGVLYPTVPKLSNTKSVA